MSWIAFLNDAAVKAAALQRATSPDSVGWAVEDSDDQRLECAQRFGLSPSLLNLLSHALHVPYGQDALQKLHQALEEISPGADSLALVRDWTLRLYEDPAYGVKARLDGTKVSVPAAELMRLIKESASRQIPREAWRKARRLVNASKGEGDDLDVLADLVIAMGWDLTVAPRSTTDIWNAWEASVIDPVNRAAGWPQSLQDEVLQAVRDAHTVAYTRLGEPPSDPEQAHLFHAEAQTRIDEELARTEFLQRFSEFKAHANVNMIPAMAAWRKVAEQSIYDACRAAKSTVC